jgi:hypothetical protein
MNSKLSEGNSRRLIHVPPRLLLGGTEENHRNLTIAFVPVAIRTFLIVTATPIYSILMLCTPSSPKLFLLLLHWYLASIICMHFLFPLCVGFVSDTVTQMGPPQIPPRRRRRGGKVAPSVHSTKICCGVSPDWIPVLWQKAVFWIPLVRSGSDFGIK